MKRYPHVTDQGLVAEPDVGRLYSEAEADFVEQAQDLVRELSAEDLPVEVVTRLWTVDWWLWCESGLTAEQAVGVAISSVGGR